ncbi:MAG: hypothetical protein WA071_06305 [Undibacterium umbellatum]|uniref:hypothetical protein n=1 Tax=Undibacterium umbellatum TaxID=2762300 RepID=UPI003BB53CAF
MATNATEDYAAIVAVRNPLRKIDTATLFDVTTPQGALSPYDQFLHNTLQLNRHWTRLGLTEELTPELGILLLLGYVSAVEGYMRALIRRLINCDQFTKNKCESLQLAYGAVLHHNSESLSDALLEETVFSSGPSIGAALTKFVGFDNFSANTKDLVAQYDAICQLRHCCVHRFGRLGAKNATALGLASHGQFLEKPVLVRKADMIDIADLLFALVKSINNEVFGFVLKRSATGKIDGNVGVGWTWKIRGDRRLFKQYYSIFASVNDATPSPLERETYEKFRAAHNRVGSR